MRLRENEDCIGSSYAGNLKLKQKLQSTKKKLKKGIEDTEQLTEELEELEQYTRKTYLEIHGVPENLYSSTEEVAIVTKKELHKFGIKKVMTAFSAGNKTLLTILTLNSNSPNNLNKTCLRWFNEINNTHFNPSIKELLFGMLNHSCILFKKFNYTLLFLRRYKLFTIKNSTKKHYSFPTLLVNSNSNTASKNSRAKFADSIRQCPSSQFASFCFFLIL